MAQQASHEYDNNQMRSILLPAGGFCGAGFEGAEFKVAVVVGGNPREARRLACRCGIAGTAVLAVFVGAPDFQDGVGNSVAVAIKDTASDGNYLIGILTGGNKLVQRSLAQTDREKRSYRLRSSRNI